MFFTKINKYYRMERPGQSKPKYFYLAINGKKISITIIKYNLRDIHYKFGPIYTEYAFVYNSKFYKLQTGVSHRYRNKHPYRKYFINEIIVEREDFYKDLPVAFFKYIPDLRLEEKDDRNNKKNDLPDNK